MAPVALAVGAMSPASVRVVELVAAVLVAAVTLTGRLNARDGDSGNFDDDGVAVDGSKDGADGGEAGNNAAHVADHSARDRRPCH